jgi:hypothetical protein
MIAMIANIILFTDKVQLIFLILMYRNPFTAIWLYDKRHPKKSRNNRKRERNGRI